MARDVELRNLWQLLDEFAYPCPRDRAVEHGREITLVLADGTVGLAEVLEASNEEAFETREDMLLEVMSSLPRQSVGEPGQSEGEG